MTTPNTGSAFWPSDWQGCRVQAQYLNLMGVPIQGTVTFTASPNAMLDYSNKKIVVPSVYTATLNANGQIDLVLPATDDPDINPNGWTYAVSENFSGGRKYSIEAPQNTTIDLSQVSPVPSGNGVAIVRGPRGATGGIQSVQGHTEPYITTLSAADVNADPAGAADNARAQAQANAIAVSLQRASNLSDLANAATARTNLGVPTDSAATANTVALRDANGRSKIATPSVALDIANKGYTDLVGIPRSSNGSAGYPSAPTNGQYVDDSVLGMLRYNGSAWTRHNIVDNTANNFIQIGGTLISWGLVAITLSNVATGTVTVTYPQAYSAVPRVVANVTGASTYFASTATVANNNFQAIVRQMDNATGSGTINVVWHAFGAA